MIDFKEKVGKYFLRDGRLYFCGWYSDQPTVAFKDVENGIESVYTTVQALEIEQYKLLVVQDEPS